MLAVFILWERYFPYPLMPLHVWKDWNFTWVSPPALSRPECF